MTVLIVILVILVFGLFILVHELGHFLTARAFGVGIHEFSIGMGPALFSKTSKKSGVKFSLRLLPIGGYVAMMGENGLEENDDASRALCNKPKWQRLCVLAAGGLTNILFGFILAAVLVCRMPFFRNTTVDSFVFYNEEDSTYYRSCDAETYGHGFLCGDKILKVGKERICCYDDLSFEIMRVGEEPTDVTVLRDGKKTVLEDLVFPTYVSDGLVFGDSSFLYTGIVEKTPLTVVTNAFSQSFSAMRMIYESLFDTLSGRYGLAAVSGPVGIVDSVSETASYGAEALIYMFMLISVNLGIMNLLPFPALDGGRIFFLLVEALRGKPVKPEFEGLVHLAGMALLLLFMAVVTYNDIVRIITG